MDDTEHIRDSGAFSRLRAWQDYLLAAEKKLQDAEQAKWQAESELYAAQRDYDSTLENYLKHRSRWEEVCSEVCS